MSIKPSGVICQGNSLNQALKKKKKNNSQWNIDMIFGSDIHMRYELLPINLCDKFPKLNARFTPQWLRTRARPTEVCTLFLQSLIIFIEKKYVIAQMHTALVHVRWIEHQTLNTWMTPGVGSSPTGAKNLCDASCAPGQGTLLLIVPWFGGHVKPSVPYNNNNNTMIIIL